MRWKARMGTGEVEAELMPNDRLGLPFEGKGQRDLRRVDRPSRVQHAANRAAAVVGTLGTGLVGLTRAGSVAMTNHDLAERVRSRNADGPAGADRRENLHRQGDQNYRQELR